ncbi:cation efflux family-domain-containing protein [Hyaloraphidium curvatum]|nr:cation efflux family-domain-containing protein [Hyaloraphidium curvatum]
MSSPPPPDTLVSKVPFVKRMAYEAIPSTPASPATLNPRNAAIADDVVVTVGPRLHRQPFVPPADDPLHLRSKIKSEEDIAQLKNRDVRAFYRRQNDLIEMFLNPPSEDFEDPEKEEMSKETRVKIAVYASTVANALLFLGQGYAALATGSLSLFATMADAFMDLISSLVLLATGTAARHVDRRRYPTGKSRLEVLGTIVFATLMSTVAIQLIVEGIKGVMSTGEEPKQTDLLAVAFIVGALVTKTALLVYCSMLSEFLSARTLAQDHRNDLIINGFGLATALAGVYLAGWVDPLGCLLVGVFILKSWASTAYEQIVLLVGASAEPEALNLLTYLALTFDERIEAVDTVRSYSLGNLYIAEIDIVLPRDMSVRESHDIAQGLQDLIEELPHIERCFVHIDYETDHTPEHTREARAEFRNAIVPPDSPPTVVEGVDVDTDSEPDREE